MWHHSKTGIFSAISALKLTKPLSQYLAAFFVETDPADDRSPLPHVLTRHRNHLKILNQLQIIGGYSFDATKKEPFNLVYLMWDDLKEVKEAQNGSG